MRCSGKMLVAAAVLVAALIGGFSSEDQAGAAPPFARRAKVPPLPAGLEWINTAGPLELSDLRGKFVLLDFWTYCCINCMHVLPELDKLEKAYPKNLVVIGVHSAKFEGEKDTKNITEAIARYNIAHPVINDADHQMWKRFGVRAWPTLLLIDPEGYAVWGNSGESTFEVLDKVIKQALPYYRKKGLLNETPLEFDMVAASRVATPLSFPGKVLADTAGERLFVADSNHNRIVIAGLDGTLSAVVGSGNSGRADGPYEKAQFNDPQGMALVGQALYVADNRNHLIRKIDLQRRSVTTVAGVGRQRREAPLARSASPLRTALASPWALWPHDRYLYIAMAGPHQIWRMRLEGTAIETYAGNGREDIVDGALLPRVPYGLGASSFAQPSGLTSDGSVLFVADSEGSSIRRVPFDRRGRVETVVGTAGQSSARLFTFGDVDGPRRAVRLQHALGVSWYKGKLYVADTYNNKIKVIDPESGETQTLVGSRDPGSADDPPQFDEPAGIWAADGKLYVADTNNHLVRVVDLANENKVSTLTFPGLEPPKRAADKDASATFGGASVKLPPTAVRPEKGSIRLAVSLTLPEGYKINPIAPTAYTVNVAGNAATPEGPIRRQALGQRVRLKKPAAEFEIALPLDATEGNDTLEVTLTYYYCREGKDGLCKAGRVRWTVPVEMDANAATSVVPLKHAIR